MFDVYAQSVKIGGQTIEGPLKDIENIGDLVNIVVSRLVFPAAGLILLIVIILGGYDLMLSRGDPAKIKSAQAKLTTGIVGIILLAVSYLGVRLLSYMFGLGGGIF